MACYISFTITKGKVGIDIKWGKNKKDLKDFKKFLNELQSGEHIDKIIKTIAIQSKKTGDIETGKNIVQSLIKGTDVLNEPIITPEELGQQELGYDT